MAYSRWGSSIWYTFWACKTDGTEETRDNATFEICTVAEFQAKQIRDDIDGCLAQVREECKRQHTEPTNAEISELRGYMQEFLARVEERYPVKSKSSERVILTKEQALSMLSDDESIHTFRSGLGMLMGCDWSRESILEEIGTKTCELGGEACQGMNHGLVIHVDGSPLFVECKDGFDYEAFEAEVLAAKA